MANYYLDIETTGLDPEKSKIITIQIQQLNWMARPVDNLIAFKKEFILLKKDLFLIESI